MKKSIWASGLWRNPQTGITINTASHAKMTEEDLKRQGYTPLQSEVKDGGELFYQKLDDGKRYEKFVPRPKGWSLLIPKPPKISDGTDEIRDKMNALISDLNVVDSNANIPNDTSYINYLFEDLKRKSDNINRLTEDELKQIEEAGIAAGLAYDPLIAQAQERMKAGMGKAIVSAGRRGGFFRTRYAGVAALTPTEARVGYVGAGGKLEAIQSAYQRNIDELIAAKNRAIMLAKQAARQAIMEGKAADFDRAYKILDFARKLDEDARRKEQEMFDRMMKIQQEERLSRAQEWDIISQLPEGMTIDIGGKKFTGIKPEKIDPFWTSSSIVDIMKSLPIGETTTIKDPRTGDEITITGLKQVTPNTVVFRSVNKNTGDETFTTIDKTTGLPINQWVSKGTGERYKYGQVGTSTKDLLKELKKEKSELANDLSKGQDKLHRGMSWGEVFNWIYEKHKIDDDPDKVLYEDKDSGIKITVEDRNRELRETIDRILDKDFWSQPGAYQKWLEITGKNKKNDSLEVLLKELQNK